MSVEIIQKRILDYLKWHAIGREYAIKSRVLFPRLRDLGIDANDRAIRDAIHSIGEVCSCSRGYYIPACHNEVVDAYLYMRSYGLSSLDRASRIRRAYPAHFPAQGELPL